MILSPEEMSGSHLDVWIARVESEVVGCPHPMAPRTEMGKILGNQARAQFLAGEDVPL